MPELVTESTQSTQSTQSSMIPQTFQPYTTEDHKINYFKYYFDNAELPIIQDNINPRSEIHKYITFLNILNHFKDNSEADDNLFIQNSHSPLIKHTVNHENINKSLKMIYNKFIMFCTHSKSFQMYLLSIIFDGIITEEPYENVEKILLLYSQAIPNYYKYLISALGTMGNGGINDDFYGCNQVKNHLIFTYYYEVLYQGIKYGCDDDLHHFTFDELLDFEDSICSSILMTYLEGLHPYFGYTNEIYISVYDYIVENIIDN